MTSKEPIMEDIDQKRSRVLFRGRVPFERRPLWLTGRVVLVGVAIVLIAGGIFLNWSTLIILGIAPAILGFVPCLTMCLLGLCHKELSLYDDAPPRTNNQTSDSCFSTSRTRTYATD